MGALWTVRGEFKFSASGGLEKTFSGIPEHFERHRATIPPVAEAIALDLRYPHRARTLCGHLPASTGTVRPG